MNIKNMSPSPNGNINSDYPFIVGLSMVKNEEDIIESFIRHNLEYIDLFCILDNGSFDNTRTILRKLQAEGLPIIIIDDPIVAYLQSEKMTKLLEHTMITLFPDFIILLDADEFIKCKNKDVFINEITEIPKEGVGLISWQSYICNASDDNKQNDNTRLVYRKEFEETINQKVIFRPEGKQVNDVIVGQGNHFLKGVKEHVNIKGISLAHLPIRSSKQLEEKCIAGCAAYLMKSPDAKNNLQGYHWFEIFDLIKQGREFTSDMLIELSENYSNNSNNPKKSPVIKDPLKFNFTNLKYSKIDNLKSVSKVAKARLSAVDQSIPEPFFTLSFLLSRIFEIVL